MSVYLGNNMADQLELDGVPAPVVKRGRGRPRVHESDAARKAAKRAASGLVQLCVELPADVAAAFDAYHARNVRDGAGLTKAQLVARLVAQQVMRKR